MSKGEMAALRYSLEHENPDYEDLKEMAMKLLDTVSFYEYENKVLRAIVVTNAQSVDASSFTSSRLIGEFIDENNISTSKLD